MLEIEKVEETEVPPAPGGRGMAAKLLAQLPRRDWNRVNGLVGEGGYKTVEGAVAAVKSAGGREGLDVSVRSAGDVLYVHVVDMAEAPPEAYDPQEAIQETASDEDFQIGPA